MKGMARQCTICGKGGMLVRKRRKLMSRYNPSPKRRQKPNLQKVRVSEEINRPEYKEYRGRTVRMCAKCRKTMFK